MFFISTDVAMGTSFRLRGYPALRFLPPTRNGRTPTRGVASFGTIAWVLDTGCQTVSDSSILFYSHFRIVEGAQKTFCWDYFGRAD